MNQDTFNPEIFKQQQENLQTEPPKKKKTGLIIILLVLVLCGIGVGLFFILNKDNKKDDEEKKENTKTEEKVKEEEKKETNEVSIYNGVYKKSDVTFSIYCISNDKCKGSFETDNYGSIEEIEIKNNKAEKDGLSYKFENNTVIITSDPNEFREDDPAATILNGNYTKEKDYTAEDYYNDNIGDSTYLNTKYNGLFELNEKKMYVFQTKNDKVRISIQGNFDIFDMEFDIQADGSLQTTFFDSKYKITVDNENAIFITLETDEDKEHDGTYKKTKILTIEDILENVE